MRHFFCSVFSASTAAKERKKRERKLKVTEKVAEVWMRQTFFVLSVSDLIVVCSDTNHLDVFLVIR